MRAIARGTNPKNAVQEQASWASNLARYKESFVDPIAELIGRRICALPENFGLSRLAAEPLWHYGQRTMAAVDETETETVRLSATVYPPGPVLHLVLIWSSDEPSRIGECAALTRPATLGRGISTTGGDAPKLEFSRSRPGTNLPTGTLKSLGLSRRQWSLTPDQQTLHVENLGKNQLTHNGVTTRACAARPGDTLGVHGVLLFLVTLRPRVLAGTEYPQFPFGSADPWGLIGESPALWLLRSDLTRIARSDAHTLIFGESGTGKELSARALHTGSRRAPGPWAARNAATLPEGLLEAELFGHTRNYPNVGMPARQGLFGQADGGTLFLDEIGELGEMQQAALLRVLDAGEYQRLGDDQSRHSNVRVIGATNRASDSLKSDLAARFTERLTVPSLNDRRCDIPLLARQLAAHIYPGVPDLRLTSELMEHLVRHTYTTHVRELDRLLRSAELRANTLELTSPLRAELHSPLPPVELDEQRVRAALNESNTAAEAARKLGLPNRFALYRVVKRFGIDANQP
jgi:hypothetical protein